MNDNTLDIALQNSGLPANESEILAHLITHGRSAAGSIARRSSLKRGSVYAALHSLVDRGLINRSRSAKTMMFSPIPRETLLSTLELEATRKIKQLQSTTASLKKLFMEIPEGKERKIDGFELETITGEKGVYEHLYESLTNESFNSIFDPQLLTKAAFKLALEVLNETREGKHNIKEIARPGPRATTYKRAVKNPNHLVKIAPSHFYIQCDCIITRERVTLISYKDNNCQALRITHPEFATLLNTLFDSAWSQLE